MRIMLLNRGDGWTENLERALSRRFTLVAQNYLIKSRDRLIEELKLIDLAIVDVSIDDRQMRMALEVMREAKMLHNAGLALVFVSRINRGPRFQFEIERMGARLLTDDNIGIVMAQAELALLEVRELANNGPQFRIVHRFHKPGTDCQAGEEIWTISLIHRRFETRLPLSLALRQIVNYLAETRHVPQSATQIAAGVHRSAFYTRHGMNSGVRSKRKVSRSAIKEYVKRIRRALGSAFREAGLHLDPKRVLVSKATVGNEIHYQLRATIQWVHISDTGFRGLIRRPGE